MKKPQLKVATTISSIPILMEALSHYHLEYPNITLVPSVMPAQKIDEALENRVIDVSAEIDDVIARRKLAAWGIEIDTLTEEQEKYLNSWKL